jgi:hypothetical protein
MQHLRGNTIRLFDVERPHHITTVASAARLVSALANSRCITKEMNNIKMKCEKNHFDHRQTAIGLRVVDLKWGMILLGFNKYLISHQLEYY